ncbi:MAG TPA: Tex family protein [Polyangiaceae bacterium]|nr:Tex family protein [Polyangiaceae bacterium]
MSPVIETAPSSASEDVYDPVPVICQELGLSAAGVRAVVAMLTEGATVPFIARYRKEATGGLDEVAIRNVEERRTYLLELEARRKSVLAEIQSQGKLTPALEAKLKAAASKAELEDLYLPYKPKRRTRAVIARERGLEPLAELLWSQAEGQKPEQAAGSFVNAEKEVPDVAAALAGARDIVAERVAEDAEVRRHARETYFKEGAIEVQKTAEHRDKVTKFDAYANFVEPLANIPSHRYLAIRRGETEGVLRAALGIDKEALTERLTKQRVRAASPWAEQMALAVKDAVSRLLVHSVEVDVRVELKLSADRAAIEVFAKNLRELLLAAPLGSRYVLGIDPGQRTGCKCVVVDETGKLLEHETVYLVQGDASVERAKQTLKAMLAKHPIVAIAVGNGTHGRETEAFARDVLREVGVKDGLPFVVSVSEAGASIYSASDIAREEFPDLDLTIRGAISIARRLQDPLAELVKLDPKSIGVGQYQHDVFQAFLAKKLDEVVESCVNRVGVELNTASASLLSRVAGLGPSVAKRIVAYRNEKGAFKSRRALLDVPGMGPKTFEQAAGFVRVRAGEHPLDQSAVHPERYELVERIAKDLGVPVVSLIGNSELLRRIDRARYQSGDVGSFTLDDIVAELLRPGRDPREEFQPPKFRDDVRTLEDLKPGMALEGVVTNVTAFGAFVDVGVHQDGLVHVSQLADRFVKDPSEVVKVGDKVNVRVLEVDLQRRRIALTRKSGAQPQTGAPQSPPAKGPPKGPQKPQNKSGSSTSKQGESFRNNPFAAALLGREPQKTTSGKK